MASQGGRGQRDEATRAERAVSPALHPVATGRDRGHLAAGRGLQSERTERAAAIWFPATSLRPPQATSTSRQASPGSNAEASRCHVAMTARRVRASAAVERCLVPVLVMVPLHLPHGATLCSPVPRPLSLIPTALPQASRTPGGGTALRACVRLNLSIFWPGASGGQARHRLCGGMFACGCSRR